MKVHQISSEKSKSPETWMLVFDPYRELRNGKKYKRDTDDKMSENGTIEHNKVGELSENTKGEVHKVRVLTQEVVND